MPVSNQSPNEQDELDDQLILHTLNNIDGGVILPAQDRDLEIGDKAEDAVDFADLSDDDLADDEDAGQPFESGPARQVERDEEMLTSVDEEREFSIRDGDGTGFDDLFGEVPSLPMENAIKNVRPFDIGSPLNEDPLDKQRTSLFETKASQSQMDIAGHRSTRDSVKRAGLTKEEQIQQNLFAMSKMSSDAVPQPVQNAEELLATLWPKYERHTVPYFMELVPGRRMHYQGKAPPKPPKPLPINKLNLELATDQEKVFKVAVGTSKTTHEVLENAGIITIGGEDATEKDDEEFLDMDSDYENEMVGNVSWHDLKIACQGWEVASLTDETEALEYGHEEELERELEWPPAKRWKSNHWQENMLRHVPITLPALHDSEATTARIAKKITLDLNDSELLIDNLQQAASAKAGVRLRDNKDSGRDTRSQSLNQRYNISNDEAYDMLKENHQQKIRGTLGHQAIEHSLPALRLQWPFYKTKLEKQEARSFHRPVLTAIRRLEKIIFNKPRHVKRKLLKGKPAQDIYVRSEDLSLGDNSTNLLLEYSEEHPAMLSNVGMGNRIINYYRRKTIEDNTRPKLKIGDLAVLMPQDKSPFSLFGHIDPGEITPTLSNAMYKAPIFSQEAKNTDFLLVKSTTGLHGSKWYMRNIDNLRVVGQEFPSVDIPGPHSRKVTTASKNRLKMISYRLVRRDKNHRINVGEVTNHFIDTNDMQNRQKMKEFMQFDKEYKEWRMRPGDIIPTEDVVRSMVKPEDVCLLESMQVGQQHLQDSGFSKDDGESEDDEAKEGQNIEQLLAPWSTSKNFLHATQGKAMLELHGEGDPSARGEAFSFIKTSMKGGFRAMGESVEEKLQGKRLKENNGHGYNVQRQQQQYEESIRRIWEAQKRSLSSRVDTSEHEVDDDELEDNLDATADINALRSETGTSSILRRQEDESASQFSHFSSRSQAGKILEITRRVSDKCGNPDVVTEIVRNPRVIRMYMKRRHEIEAEATKLEDLIGPTGHGEIDKRNEKLLQKELARLERNKERRQAREKQKGILPTDGADEGVTETGSPGTPASGIHKSSGGTSRKCANCGQVGHIKTNKKLCPMLNGTMKPEEGFSDNAFTASAPAL